MHWNIGILTSVNQNTIFERNDVMWAFALFVISVMIFFCKMIFLGITKGLQERGRGKKVSGCLLISAHIVVGWVFLSILGNLLVNTIWYALR